MRTFLISYDLANPNAKKHAIADIIMGSGERWARPLEQTWYVESDESAEQLEARLSWLLGDEDGLLVQAIGQGSVMTNTSLRWFRRRGADGGATQNVVTFPVSEEALAA